ATPHARALAKSAPGQPGDWAFGSGHQAITFVSRVDAANYMEHGESWYKRSGGYAPTPGHRQPGGVRYRIFDPTAGILRCFACHSTGPLSQAADESIVVTETGVRCEDCHGPSAVHANSPASVRPLNPGKLNGGQINELCGACHRMPLGVDA